MTVQLRLAVLFSMIATGICQLEAQDYPQQSSDDLVTNQFWKCGIPNRVVNTDRIVGGQNADLNEYPWQVGLSSVKGGDINCGGSIISSKTILTAAHCFSDEMWVVVGEHDRGKSQGEGWIKVCNKEKHEKYENLITTLSYDVGVLHLCKEIAFTKEIAPVCLPTTAGQGTQYEGKNAVATGWGRLGTDENFAQILQEVTVKTMKNTDCCKAPYDHWECSSLDDSVICAAAPGKDICAGDSGGPLVIKENYSYTQVGITSFGPQNCGHGQANAPGGYARVTNQLQWIKDRTKGTKGLVPTTSIPGVCRKGDYKFGYDSLRYFRGSLYYFHSQDGKSLSWNDAENYCKDWFQGDAELSSITSLAEFNFIVSTIKEENMGSTFIGGKRKSQYSDEWIMPNGLPLDAVRFNQTWISGEPNNYGENENVLMIAAPIYSWNKDRYGLNDLNDWATHHSTYSFVCRIYC